MRKPLKASKDHDINIMRKTLLKRGISQKLVNTLNEQQVKNIYYVVAGLVVNDNKERDYNE